MQENKNMKQNKTAILPFSKMSTFFYHSVCKDTEVLQTLPLKENIISLHLSIILASRACSTDFSTKSFSK